ncbi:MAG: ATP synthase F1 subunit delta [Parcubacteria group bacterium]|jgi:F-type H+-transporting ATPase subunit delta
MKITAIQYANTLYELTDGKTKQEVDGVVAGFLKVLRKNNQLKMAGKIIEKFSNLYNQKNGIVEAEVTSREALSKDVGNKLRNYVSTKYKAKEVVIKNKIDEGIKGGIIIKVGDEIVDASISGKLRSLKSSLEK